MVIPRSLSARCTPPASCRFPAFTPVNPRLSRLRLIAWVMRTKAVSTLLPLSALVSTKGTPSSAASASPSRVLTCRSWAGRSILLPTSTASRNSPPSCFARSNHFWACSKDSRLVTSYTNSAPWAPRLEVGS